MKAILCHSESFDSIRNWEYVTDEIEKAGDNSSAIFVSELVEIAKANKMTWSERLVSENAPARWITYRGNHLLIKQFGSGKEAYAKVIYAGNPAFEHLKIYPKTSKEYGDIKDKIDTKKDAKAKKFDAKKEEAVKVAKKQKVVEKKKLKQSLFNRVSDLLASKKDKTDDVVNTLVSGRDKDSELLRATASKEKAEQEKAAKQIKDIVALSEGMNESEKNNTIIQLTESAEDTIVDEVLGGRYEAPQIRQLLKTEREGRVIEKGEKESTTKKRESSPAKKKADEILADMDIDFETSKRLLATASIYKEEVKNINNKYRDDVVENKSNLEITSLQGIGIVDWDKKADKVPDVIEQALKHEESRIRALNNTELYNIYTDTESKSTTKKGLVEGGMDTYNAISNVMLKGAGLSKRAVDIIGLYNASRVLADYIDKTIGSKKALDDLEKVFGTQQQKAPDELLKDVKGILEDANDYDEMAKTGMYLDGTLQMAKMRGMKKAMEELGAGIGSMEVAASVIDSLKDIKNSVGDIEVNSGARYKFKSLNEVIKAGKSIGLDYKKDEFSVKKEGEEWRLHIPTDSFDKMISDTTINGTRDAEWAKIKSQSERTDWMPKNITKEAYPAITEQAMKMTAPENKKDWVKFTNEKGVDGYTSKQPIGATLYRTSFNVKMEVSQEKMTKAALLNKKILANFGAGTGKTLGFLGTIGELKGRGELDTFAFHTMPSRLRDEFARDKDLFAPNLTALNLDEIKGYGAKMEALDNAAKGKYDIVYGGHDSIKGRAGMKSERYAKEYLTKKYKQMSKEEKGQMGMSVEQYLKTPVGKEEVNHYSGLFKKGIPDMVKNVKPSIVTVDETHESFTAPDKKETQRFSAMKDFLADTPYAILATGTPIRNSISELGSYLNVLNPEKVPNPKEFGKDYNAINKHTTVFKDLSTDGLNRRVDDMVISQKLDIKNKSGEKVKMNEHSHKVELHPKQQSQIKTIETIYQTEKSMKGFGIISKDDYSLVGGTNTPKLFPDLPFTPKDNSGKVTPQASMWLKKQGYDGANFEITKMGTSGAAQRRRGRERLIIDAGNWKENAKMTELSNLYENTYKGKEPMVVYYERNATLDTLKSMFSEKHGKVADESMFWIDGSTKIGKGEGQRDWRVTKFQGNTTPDVMFVNMAGKTGITLNRAATGVYVTPESSDFLYNQGKARVMRKGQQRDVDMHVLNSNTILDKRAGDLRTGKAKQGGALKGIDTEASFKGRYGN